MTSSSASTPTSPALSRNVLIAGSVVLFHAAALWALQTGLLRRAVEVIVPAEIIAEFVEPPQPKVEPPPPVPKKLPVPVKQPVARKPDPLPPPPLPVAIADPTPAPAAPTGVTTPPPPAPPIAAPVAVAPVAPPPPPKVELPSSDADYLQNPKPAYPAISKRLGEQGKVVIRVLIGTDGTAQKAEIRQSSGYDRLDQAALTTVQRWRYVPGKRNGVAEAMWFNIPINFVLE
ncbi:MAG: energy transducer TonB [Ramlibacter sp.]|nr:energy transducer TonB [Ramlibacter sp.]MBX3659090.1 energy transducer TonB [Ramlibacter sp.]MCW5650390.1 energy transducer TonB [Ramlibacter sp.]